MWEYEVLLLDVHDISFARTLSRYGEANWELVTVVEFVSNYRTYARAYMKRLKKV
jgi:hypothetical protein